MQLVKLIYDLVYSEERRRAGMRLTPAELDRQAAVRAVVEGDPAWNRRRFRRLPILLPAMVKSGTLLGRALLRNISGGGTYLVSSVELRVGDRVQVKVGRAGEPQYTFPGIVRRSEHCTYDECFHVAVEFEGIPLEIRRGAACGQGEADELLLADEPAVAVAG